VFLALRYEYITCILFTFQGERLTRRVRSMMFHAVLRQEMAFFDDKRNSTGALTARLSDEAETIQKLTGPAIGSFFQLIVSMGVAIGLAFSYSWRLTLVVLVRWSVYDINLDRLGCGSCSWSRWYS
jgi:ABC-type multidrug transport system fused ATPase/permease subunit